MEFRPIQAQALAEPLILRVRSHGLLSLMLTWTPQLPPGDYWSMS
jgi:hypothetical protein